MSRTRVLSLSSVHLTNHCLPAVAGILQLRSPTLMVPMSQGAQLAVARNTDVGSGPFQLFRILSFLLFPYAEERGSEPGKVRVGALHTTLVSVRPSAARGDWQPGTQNLMKVLKCGSTVFCKISSYLFLQGTSELIQETPKTKLSTQNRFICPRTKGRE